MSEIWDPRTSKRT